MKELVVLGMLLLEPVLPWCRAARWPWSSRSSSAGTARSMGGYAEEWISEVSLAVRAEVPVTVHADVVHPFPTYGEILEAPLWRLAAQLPS